MREKGMTMSTHVEIGDLAKQWELAGIWMRDANVHSMLPPALLDQISSREIADEMLDKYFDMVEQILSQPGDVR
jgi:hypothetical protein